VIKGVFYDLDGTLVEKFGTKPLPKSIDRLAHHREYGQRMAICTNQAGPLWRMATGNEMFPTTEMLIQQIEHIIQNLNAVAVPWFISIGDLRVAEKVGLLDYEEIVKDIRSKLDLKLPFMPPFNVEFDPKWRKPEPGMLLAAAAFWKLKPEECQFVGDNNRDEDRQAATAAGMAFELVQ
jgi:histidinol phosphatase-like enzyme